MLETGRINLVPPPETEECTFCGARYEQGREFVSFDNSTGAGRTSRPD